MALAIGAVGAALAVNTLVAVTAASASSPEAIDQHQREVTERCLQVSGLQNPQPVGRIAPFGDQVGYDALVVRGSYAQPPTNAQAGQVLCLFDRRTRQAYTSAIDLSSRYTSGRAGFQFEYPAGFVAQPTIATGDDRLLERVDLWTQRDYDGLQASTTPTELPPNVSVLVQQNPQRLTLEAWVRQSNQFVLSERFTPITVAGQPAIAFRSTGLYEYENIVLAVPNSSTVVTIQLDQDGRPEHDAVYRPVFEQIVSSLQFSAQ